MRDLWRYLLVTLVVPWAMAQDDSQKLQLSKDPLTTDEIAVYRAVLEDYVKRIDGELHLSNRTYPSARGIWAVDCVKYAGLETVPKSMVVHLLDRAVALSAKVVLVDPDWQPVNKKNDADNAIRKGNENTRDNDAFRNGLFTFSEIAFDKQHRHAVLTYLFSCPGFCGHSDTLVLEKTDGVWKITRQCAGMAV